MEANNRIVGVLLAGFFLAIVFPTSTLSATSIYIFNRLIEKYYN